MDGAKSGQLAALFGGLAHPTRVRMIQRLAEQPMNVTALCKGLELGQPSVSQHLAVLERLGLVVAERSGTSRIYRLRGPRVAVLVETVSEFCEIHGLMDSLPDYGNDTNR